jgi:hypothetical protein
VAEIQIREAQNFTVKKSRSTMGKKSKIRGVDDSSGDWKVGVLQALNSQSELLKLMMTEMKTTMMTEMKKLHDVPRQTEPYPQPEWETVSSGHYYSTPTGTSSDHSLEPSSGSSSRSRKRSRTLRENDPET